MTVKLLFVITRFCYIEVTCIFHDYILLLLGLKENRLLYQGLRHIKVLLFCNDSYLRAVAKISSCWVNAVSRRGIVLSCVGISSFGSVFVLFPIREAGAHTHSTQVKSPAPSSW